MMRSKTEAEKRAAMIDQHLYDEEARHILSLGSVEEIERFVATTVGLDHTLLSRTLEQMAQRLFGMGRAAEARLTHFVLDIVNDFIRRREAPVPQPKNIITFETLMDAAAAAPSALRAVTLLRQHSHLLSLEGADQFQSLVLEQLNKARPHSSPRAVRLLLCLVMVGKLLNDPERAATYQILWGGYCRNEGRYRHALRRLARAEEIGNAIKNPFLQISSLAGRASLYELLGNNARAADAYLKALNLARESGNEYLTPPTVIKLAGCYRGMHRYSDAGANA